MASAVHLSEPRPQGSITARTKPTSAASHAWRRDAIQRLWASSRDPTDSTAEPLRTYLSNRGLGTAVLDPGTLRFHPNLPYWENGQQTGHYPAMIARVTSPTGALVTLHRTYLTEDSTKAPVASPKKLMAYPADLSLAGAAIRLARPSPDRTLGLAEGIETALAVMLMTGEPTWAATSAGMMERFEPPPEVEHLTVNP